MDLVELTPSTMSATGFPNEVSISVLHAGVLHHVVEQRAASLRVEAPLRQDAGDRQRVM
jgi:hypothetical protein